MVMQSSRRARRRVGLDRLAGRQALSGMLVAMAGCHGVQVSVVPAAHLDTADPRPIELATASFPQETPPTEAGAVVERAGRDGWFLEIGVQQYHPRLNSSESLIDRRLTRPNTILFPGEYRNIETFDDLADAGKLWLPMLGVGKRVESWLTLSGYFMAGCKSISNFRRLNGLSTVDADFDAALYALSFKASLLPFGQPERAHDGSLRAVLLGARPAIDQGIEVEYLHGEGDGGFKAVGWGVDRVKRTYRDWNVSYNPGLSWEFPLDERSSVVVGGNYNFHVYRHNELDGWNLILSVRYQLR